MDINQIIIIALVLTIVSAAVAYFLFFNKKNNSSNLASMIKTTRMDYGGKKNAVHEKMDEANKDIRQLTEAQRENYTKQRVKVTEEERYYHAGLFSEKQRSFYKKLRLYLPIGAGVFLTLFTFLILGRNFALFGLAVGVLGGLSLPGFYLDRIIKKRQEEIMYYLPLVIEQIAIGVSSSLDIGPCLQRVVQMADERDSHNVVTELIYHAEGFIRTGVSLEEAMNEVGNKAGHSELKHAFMALAQVSKHGGEISHQLHELAHAVSSQRETQVDARIKKLELHATGPVALVFIAFMATLMTGIMIKIKNNL